MIGSDTCSSLATDEPLAGTAPFARAWLVVEHPGPWGRDALTDSGIPDDVVKHISSAQRQAALRFIAARSIARGRRHLGVSMRRRVWLAVCGPDGGEGRTATIDQWSTLLEWDLASLGHGHLPPFGEELTEPMAFVCTHSRRDRCCAVLGRALITSVPDRWHDRVWECSHLGGHRFAPTCLYLPSGRLYGRLMGVDGFLADPVSEPGPQHLRGPSYLAGPFQAAECAARIDGDLPASSLVRVTALQSIESGQIAAVTSSTGGEWIVSCQPDSVVNPASCNGPSEERTVWRTHIIDRRT